MFAQAGDSSFWAGDSSYWVQMFSDFRNPFPMIVCVVAVVGLVKLAGVARNMIRDHREQTLRHEERLAMIDAGLHPDHQPEEPIEDGF